MRSTLAIFVLVLVLAALISPESAWAPTMVEYIVGPVGVTTGQTAEMKCLNNFAPGGAQIRLTFVDPSDPSVPLAGGKVVDVPFHGLATLDVNVSEAVPGLPPGHRLSLMGVIEIVTGAGPGFLEQEPLLPGASLQLFDTASGRTELVVLALRNRGKTR